MLGKALRCKVFYEKRFGINLTIIEMKLSREQKTQALIAKNKALKEKFKEGDWVTYTKQTGNKVLGVIELVYFDAYHRVRAIVNVSDKTKISLSAAKLERVEK